MSLFRKHVIFSRTIPSKMWFCWSVKIPCSLKHRSAAWIKLFSERVSSSRFQYRDHRPDFPPCLERSIFLIHPNPPQCGQHCRLGTVRYPWPRQPGQGTIPYFSGRKFLFRIKSSVSSSICFTMCGSPREKIKFIFIRSPLRVAVRNSCTPLGPRMLR